MIPLRGWYAFEEGATLGTQGSEAGVILLDQEYDQAARISLERETRVAPFAITCGVYGLMFHTRYFASEAEARRDYDLMKTALTILVDGLASRNQQVKQKAQKLLDEFVERFPT